MGALFIIVMAWIYSHIYGNQWQNYREKGVQNSMAEKIFWVHQNSYHREKGKETNIKSYLLEWYIKQPWVKH